MPTATASFDDLTAGTIIPEGGTADGIAFTILVAEDEEVLAHDRAHQLRAEVDVAHGNRTAGVGDADAAQFNARAFRD